MICTEPIVNFPGYYGLSEPEKEVFELLKLCDHDSLWNTAITNVINKPDPVRFRRLVSELKSQNNDNPEVMQTILGPAYEALVAI